MPNRIVKWVAAGMIYLVVVIGAYYIIASGKTPGFSCGDESERQTREGSPLLQV